jgi:hypothetical protein
VQEIKTMEQWGTLAGLLREHGYRLWQWQYDAAASEGFQACFIKSGRPDVRILTRDAKVQAAIVAYKQ